MSIEWEIFTLLTAGAIAVSIVIAADYLYKRSVERAEITAYSDQEFFDKMIRGSNRTLVRRNTFDQNRQIYYIRCTIATGPDEIYLGKTKHSNETVDEFYARIRQAYNQGGLLPDLEIYGDFTNV